MYQKAPIDEIIWRWGVQAENINQLNESSQDAYDVIQIHGVTAFAGEIPSEIKLSTATVKELTECGFFVYVTPLNSTPEHRTIELPKPVTNEMLLKWNDIWNRV